MKKGDEFSHLLCYKFSDQGELGICFICGQDDGVKIKCCQKGYVHATCAIISVEVCLDYDKVKIVCTN